MNDLIAFIRARIDEDEARVHGDEHDAWHTGWCGYGMFECLDDCGCDVPDRVLAEVAAKRGVLDSLDMRPCPCARAKRCVVHDASAGGPPVERYLNPTTDRVVRLFALPYSSHPEYREEWRP